MNKLYFDIAPINLRSMHTTRYDGTGFSATLEDFSPIDVQILKTIYEQIKAVYDLWLYMKDAPQYQLLQPIIEQFTSGDIVLLGKQLGETTQDPSQHLQKILHDIRGGALTTMISYAHRISKMNMYGDVEFMRSFVFLARDQTKMMRSAIDDIDSITRAADERFRIHSIYDYVKKWNGFVYPSANHQNITVKVQCFFEGNITTCCLEASALDRVVYNYINNALRFAASDTITLTILPIGNVLRWVVENLISSDNVLWQKQNIGTNWQELYKGGITNGGHGIGLANCADIVAASFNISSANAIEEGYVGATVIDSTYYGWFHWNAVQ
jgi:signal transduction histidine kinase